MDEAMWMAILTMLAWWMVAAIAIFRWGPGRVNLTVICPEHESWAKVRVLRGEAGFGELRVLDVTACSLFEGKPLTCGKRCLAYL